jgi:hypothetical protein
MPGAYSQESLESHFAVINERLDYIERGIAGIARAAGVAYATYAETLNVPDEVAELARAGQQLQAIQKYRQLTGASLEQARKVVIAL